MFGVRYFIPMNAELLPTHTPALFQEAVRRAVQLLRAGEVVALPTETVYGLAANAFDPAAVARIYKIKGRPAHNPVIVHVADAAMARRCVSDWPDAAERLRKAFWPGPLSLVLPRAKIIPDIVTSGGDTVGVRWPGHPFIQAVIRECNFPLAAPSANPSNAVSATNAAHVQKTLGEKLRLIIDGGQSQVGIESTVLDVTQSPPRVLRPGMIHEESLVAVVGEIQHGSRSSGQGVLRSPGLLEKHYAPKARLKILQWTGDDSLRDQVSALNLQPSSTQIIAHTHIPSQAGFAAVSVIPHDAEAFARAIYAELHRCDDAGAGCIVIETPPETPEWRAIHDRLKRAAA
jgi:L-threonylcarbamoyladenylate synthase